jgi:hypothetical protein
MVDFSNVSERKSDASSGHAVIARNGCEVWTGPSLVKADRTKVVVDDDRFVVLRSREERSRVAGRRRSSSSTIGSTE